jgi:hypothetical protein
VTRRSSRSGRAHVPAALVLIALAGGLTRSGGAQPIAASTLKAAFMLNFAKFTEWPAREPGLPILICVSASDEVADAMARTIKGQLIDGRSLQVSQIAAAGSVGGCQMLFVADRDPRRLAAILDEASRFPVLTVSDIEQSSTAGVMVELFRENGRMRFAINIDTVGRSPVRISSQLLALAKIARDVPSR